MQQSYQPSEKILEKYADLIVRFGMKRLDGSALKPGSVIQFIVPEVAKPLYFHLQNAILKNGHHPIGTFVPSTDDTYNIQAAFFKYAKADQIQFCPFLKDKGMVDQIDGLIHVIAESHRDPLKKVSSDLLLQRSVAMKKSVQYRRKKQDDDKLSWTIALYGTDAMAAEAALTPKQYWNQIINACYLDTPNPVAEWEKINTTVKKTATKLTALKIQSLHFSGEDVDLQVGIGDNRVWKAGGGCNIPSYEVFTSPNWRQVNGWIRLNQPHSRYGKRIEGIELWFKNGIVIKSSATKNHAHLKSILEAKNGNKLGEVSLTDARLSRITKYMGEILYDENIGGKYGNTHIALGASFRDCFNGTPDPTWKTADWDKLGFNDSVVHSDVISTTNRTVTATLADGSTKVIYKDGRFTI